ncbi:MAG: hypothetical protein AMXMBFR84_21060 [Candidatus Hydrogenedentota bacterium]
MSLEPITIIVRRRFTQSAERVFDAWLDPAKARQFLFATETGVMVCAEIDARVGGSFTFTDRRNGNDVAHFGHYFEIDRPRRLVFSVCVPEYSHEYDRVTIEIEALDSGCELTLTHEMRPEWKDMIEGVTAGWTGILEGLAKAIA